MNECRVPNCGNRAKGSTFCRPCWNRIPQPLRNRLLLTSEAQRRVRDDEAVRAHDYAIAQALKDLALQEEVEELFAYV